MPYGITVATDEKAIGKALYEPLAPFPTQVPPWIKSFQIVSQKADKYDKL